MARRKSLHPLDVFLERAERFSIQTPMRYRKVGQSDWHEGMTENISRTGVLFTPEDFEDALQLDTPLEMMFTAPTEIAGDGNAQVLYRGYPVRTLMPTASDENPEVAAQFADFQILLGEGN